MITGTVQYRQANVVLRLIGQRSSVEVEFEIDTGFSGQLAIPTELSRQLGLFESGETVAVMADGRAGLMPTAEVEIEWMDGIKLCDAMCFGDTPLLGMSLLEGNDLHIEVVEGGQVEISPL